MNAESINKAYDLLPDYIKLNYSNHAIMQAKIKSRDVLHLLPDKVKKYENMIIVKAYWVDNGHTLDKIKMQVDIGLKNLALEIIYIPSARLVKTVYKTKKRF